MPIISMFYGIKIALFYDDHAPPHFHAYYGEYQATFDIKILEITSGKFPKRATKLVLEWGTMNQEKLLEEWKKAENHEELFPIEPLM